MSIVGSFWVGIFKPYTHTMRIANAVNQRLLLITCLLMLPFMGDTVALSQTAISTGAYNLLNARTSANQQNFFVYSDQDSGLNKGFPSGFFASTGNLGTIHIDTGCIDDASSNNGCSTDPNALDLVRGTVLRVSFDAQSSGNFAGLNIEEPENWGVLQTGTGYDLQGATTLTFDVRSPGGAAVQFGVGECVTNFMTLSQSWTTLSIPLSSLVPPPGSTESCPPALSSVHVLFTVLTNDTHAPNGATVLLDNVRFTPTPTSQQSALGFPLGNQTFGVVPQQSPPIPPDQVLRNLTTVYESALTELALLSRGAPTDLVSARVIADTFDYVLHHESHGDPLPVAPDGSVGLHNGYENGDPGLFNSQQTPELGQAGDARLAGFSATVCAPSNYCLVLDGATGGNNSFAILALLSAYGQSGDARYLDDARMIGQWIVGALTDVSGIGYGGYFLGYPDQGVPPPKPLQTGKSTENCADIFAALSALATVESRLGNSTAAAQWTTAANTAGDFVMQMFDSASGRFNAGTVPVGTPASAGICPTGAQNGNDVINECDFLDATTFTMLALAGSSRYYSQIDWRAPMQFALTNFAQTITAVGMTFQGFDIVPVPVSGPNGVAWEFTGQMVEAMRFTDQLYSQTSLESTAELYLAQIAQAQSAAPFSDGAGLVAATAQSGDSLPPSQQCVQTPFQCIAERVGLAATNWAILSEGKLNPFILPTPAVPSAPTGLIATGGDGQVSLSWAAVAGANSYNIYEGTTAGAESATAAQTGVIASSTTVTGLAAGATYYFTVGAVNAAGISGQSQEASAATTAPVANPGGKGSGGGTLDPWLLAALASALSLKGRVPAPS